MAEGGALRAHKVVLSACSPYFRDILKVRWDSLFQTLWQSDQIGRIFASWAIVYLRHFLKITEEAHIVGLLISTVKVICILALSKMCAASFWAIFSQTHLVTLLCGQFKKKTRRQLQA
jgi:hypothetical protein